MDNPNVASGGKPRDFLQTIGGPYQLSNGDAVKGTTYSFGKQSDITAQPPVAPRGAQPSFEKLQPKAMPVVSSVPGTDYIP